MRWSEVKSWLRLTEGTGGPSNITHKEPSVCARSTEELVMIAVITPHKLTQAHKNFEFERKAFKQMYKHIKHPGFKTITVRYWTLKASVSLFRPTAPLEHTRRCLLSHCVFCQGQRILCQKQKQFQHWHYLSGYFQLYICDNVYVCVVI